MISSGETADRENGTSSADPGEGQPAKVTRSETELSSAARSPIHAPDEVRVTTGRTDKVTIYYDAEIVERRRSIYRTNRGQLFRDTSESD